MTENQTSKIKKELLLRQTSPQYFSKFLILEKIMNSRIDISNCIEKNVLHNISTKLAEDLCYLIFEFDWDKEK